MSQPTNTTTMRAAEATLCHACQKPYVDYCEDCTQGLGESWYTSAEEIEDGWVDIDTGAVQHSANNSDFEPLLGSSIDKYARNQDPRKSSTPEKSKPATTPPAPRKTKTFGEFLQSKAPIFKLDSLNGAHQKVKDVTRAAKEVVNLTVDFTTKRMVSLLDDQSRTHRHFV